MEVSKFHKSPEILLSETLHELTQSFDSLKNHLREFSLSFDRIRTEFHSTVEDAARKDHTGDETTNLLKKLKQDSRTELSIFHGCFQEYLGLIETFRDFFGVYQVDYAFWLKHEGQLQKASEEYRASGENVVNKYKESVGRLRRSIEQTNKSLAEIQDNTLIQEETKQEQKTKRASCLCVLPRSTRRCFRFVSHRCCTSKSQRSSSYENLVLQKEQSTVALKNNKEGSKIKKTDDFVVSTMELLNTLVSESHLLHNAMCDVTNGMSYLHQDLCRLDYLDANKEKHFEIVEESAPNLIKQCNAIYNGITNTMKGELSETETG